MPGTGSEMTVTLTKRFLSLVQLWWKERSLVESSHPVSVQAAMAAAGFSLSPSIRRWNGFSLWKMLHLDSFSHPFPFFPGQDVLK